MKENVFVYVISDALGETGELVAKAAISQYDTQQLHIRRYSYVTDKKHLKEIIDEAKENKCIIVYTLVLPELEKYLLELTEKNNLTSIDLLGPLIKGISQVTSVMPKLEPGLIRKLDEQYFRKVDAIDFAVKYDDGKDPKGLLYADIVLIGVSRTSKTPLSMYLGNKRIRTANLPLVPEVDPPKELFNIPKNKIFGLIIKPESLFDIRKERLKSLGLSETADYANQMCIYKEIEYAKGIMEKLDCHIIDVSNKAVEENANYILDIYSKEERYGK